MENPESTNKLVFADDEDVSSLYDEDKIILDVTTTPYEKVLKILGGMKNFLHDLGKLTLKTDLQLQEILDICSEINLFEVTDDLNWVIKRIQSHTLYTYEVNEEEELEKLKQDNLEMQSFLEMLSDYSETKDIKRRNKMPISRTHKLQEKPLLLRQEFNQVDRSNENQSTIRKKHRELILNQMSIDIKKQEFSSEKQPKLNNSLITPSSTKIIEEKKDSKKDLTATIEKKTEQSKTESKPASKPLESIPLKNTSFKNDKNEKQENNKSNNLSPTRIKFEKKSSKDNNKKASHNYLIKIVDEDEKTKNKLNIQNKIDNPQVKIFGPGDELAKESDSTKMEKIVNKIGENPLITLIKLEDNSSSNANSSSAIPQILINEDDSNRLPKLSWDSEAYSLCDPKSILSNDFNIHQFTKSVGKKNTLSFISKMIFTAFDLCYLIDMSKLESFSDQISKGYLDVTYHNSIHGADVTQTVANWIFNSNIEEHASLTDNEVLAILSASLAHDIGHPGTNNAFQINSYSEYALNFNDNSVLENYHCAYFFKISRKPENNIYSKFTDAEYRQFRKRIIECILATDMVFHAKIVSQMKGRIMIYKESLKESEVYDEKIPMISKDSTSIFDEQQHVLNFIIHTADIAHNSKPFEISQKWTEYLMEEFWQQGDKEKKLGLPISFLCDRSTADVPKGQIGFFKAIIMPTFDALIDLLPDLTYVREQIDKNYDEWSKLINENKPVTIFAKSPRLLKSPRMMKSPHLNARNAYNTNRQATNSATVNTLLGFGMKKLQPK